MGCVHHLEMSLFVPFREISLSVGVGRQADAEHLRRVALGPHPAGRVSGSNGEGRAFYSRIHPPKSSGLCHY
jgi:hypothetical protein